MKAAKKRKTVCAAQTQDCSNCHGIMPCDAVQIDLDLEYSEVVQPHMTRGATIERPHCGHREDHTQIAYV